MLKNITSNESRSDLAASDDPATANDGCAFTAFPLKVYDVPGAILIGNSKHGILFQSRGYQRSAKFLCMNSGHFQTRLKDSRFVPSARMNWT